VDEVARADGVAVAVAAGDHHFDVGTGHFDAGPDRKRASVDAVERVAVHVRADLSGTADAGDDEGVIGVVARLREGLHHSVHGAEVAASRTPRRLLVGLEIGESNV
jgi:hypothetical protein